MANHARLPGSALRQRFSKTASVTLIALALFVPSLRSESARPGPDSQPVDQTLYDRIIHVDGAHGTDITGDGSMKNPVASIVAALEKAGAPSADKRVAIFVSQGVYTQPTFVLKAHVDLFGGYATPGGERDIWGTPSILDGEDQRRILLGADHARLDGFHLIRGRVRGKGAALLCDATSPVITNCVFRANRTLIPENWDPALIHETGNDGGAVMILNGSRARIENCVFFQNTTECGRGGALSVDRAAHPRITHNVFANNRAGLDDPMRSSDGGAVSFFDWSDGEFVGNLVINNEALASNDAGGVFVALWSAPLISDNIVVGNVSGDDAGGLFIGGQEHRYDTPLDPYPPADEFEVIVERNILAGNSNSSRNSGATRITMESRVRLTDNIVAGNAGGLYLQRSEVIATRNTVWQDWRFVEDKETLGPSVFTGNILLGPAGPMEANATFIDNRVDADVPGTGNRPVEDIFENDSVAGEITTDHFDSSSLTTVLDLKEPLPEGVDFTNRIVSVDKGRWSVVKSATPSQLVLWGRLRISTTGYDEFEILRTFTPRQDAPPGIGAGAPSRQHRNPTQP
ncbi:MAG: right-handed parallel beta-helix repeat-containing protein [Opitutaceae bacterium]